MFYHMCLKKYSLHANDVKVEVVIKTMFYIQMLLEVKYVFHAK